MRTVKSIGTICVAGGIAAASFAAIPQAAASSFGQPVNTPNWGAHTRPQTRAQPINQQQLTAHSSAAATPAAPPGSVTMTLANLNQAYPPSAPIGTVAMSFQGVNIINNTGSSKATVTGGSRIRLLDSGGLPTETYNIQYNFTLPVNNSTQSEAFTGVVNSGEFYKGNGNGTRVGNCSVTGVPGSTASCVVTVTVQANQNPPFDIELVESGSGAQFESASLWPKQP